MMRVLVIEDTAHWAELFSKWAEQEGHSVQVACTAVDGLRAVRSFAPDVLLLDIGLPDMDGWQVARAIRRNDQFAELKLIVISAFDSQEHCRQSKEIGIDFHLGKPATRKQLAEILSRLEQDRRLCGLKGLCAPLGARFDQGPS